MRGHRDLAVGVGLSVITLILYWPVTTFPFTDYDDMFYVYANPNVINGLSWEGLKWVWTAFVVANWHPLTMLSHMADSSIYGRFAGGHHLTNLLIHTANVLLIWRLFQRLTKSFWSGALIAALFAWHPLNVESVAWIAERKNVLSTFFLILTLRAYLDYVEKPGPGKYALALGLFALGLMCKPMLVTLPCILLLLDYWPLRRVNVEVSAVKNWRGLLLEKLPFFFLAGAAIVVTLMAQRSGGAVKSLREVPLALRALNMPVAYVTYIAKTIWPVNLCISYPLPEKLPVLAAAVSSVLLAGMTGLVFRWRLRFGWTVTGWFWFLGTLVPVIGIVQVGSQALADRYAYVPLLGLFLLAACGLCELTRLKPQFRLIVVTLTCLFLVSCLFLTRQQIMYWRNSVELFKHAIAIEPDNPYIHEMLGATLSGNGERNEAIEHYLQAARLKPDNVDFQYYLGCELIEAGRFSEAEGHLGEAIKRVPDNATLHNSLGVALVQEGKVDRAINEFGRAIQIQPDYPKPYLNLGKIERQSGHDPAALTNFSMAVQLDPNWPEALDNLALLLATCPQPQFANPGEAIKLSLRANSLTHNASPFFLKTLARAYAAGGNFSNAASVSALALEIAITNRLGSLTNQIAAESKAYQSGNLPPKSTAGVAPENIKPQPHN
jgi:tetratricopeptide (TPR) repeat protein